jgi:hypothetical protein
MNIKHKPIFNTDKVAAHYSEKDGVEIKYICTTEFDKRPVCDIFFRKTPHPTFGNRYFGLYHDDLSGKSFILDADCIDGDIFGMIFDGEQWHYSSHRHDYIQIGDNIIDGGRDYIRGNGIQLFRLLDGTWLKVC